jgi:hypothetical protein
MEGVLLVAGVVAVLVGLGALVEAPRPKRRRTGRRQRDSGPPLDPMWRGGET